MIMTDADVDGNNIRVCCAHCSTASPLIEHGFTRFRVAAALSTDVPGTARTVRHANSMRWTTTNAKRSSIACAWKNQPEAIALSALMAPSEMESEQLWETTMLPDTVARCGIRQSLA